MSPAHRDEAVAAAIHDTFTQFDSIKPDGKIDKEEFVTHLKGISFPSFPNSEPLLQRTLSDDVNTYYTSTDPRGLYQNTADPTATTTFKNFTTHDSGDVML